jgi:hypothetical protein
MLRRLKRLLKNSDKMRVVMPFDETAPLPKCALSG